MSLAMTRDEREAFLADVHVGVFAANQEGNAPLAVPVWYDYTPDGTVDVITSPTSVKARLVEASGRFSLCAQTESPPYKYVMVEGAVVSVEPATPAERRAMAHRYLGPELGDAYIAATAEDAADNVVVRMRPQSWRTVDYTKQFG